MSISNELIIRVVEPSRNMRFSLGTLIFICSKVIPFINLISRHFNITSLYSEISFTIERISMVFMNSSVCFIFGIIFYTYINYLNL